MEMTDKILLGLLLLAVAAFPVAVFLYLRTAYRKGGWTEVKWAAIVAAVALLIVAVPRLWFEWEISHLERIIEHPFSVSSILFIVVAWLAHRALYAQLGETDVYH